MASAAENEVTFYARIGDFSGVAQAVAKETHEQWSYPVKGEDGHDKGSARIRATARGDSDTPEVQYHQTLKLRETDNGLHSCTEHTTVIDKTYFDAWKQLFGTKGIFKTRYIFLSKNVTLKQNDEEIILPEVKYEIDVFLNAQGQRSKWCKIDIELDKIIEYLADKHQEIDQYSMTVALSSLPLKLEEAFCSKDMDEAHQEAVSHLWENFSHRVPSEGAPSGASGE